jgi:hypothetical protein
MKQMYLLWALTLALSAGAAGCAPALYVPLKPENAKVGSTRVYASIPQEEITAVVEKLNLAGGAGGVGLIGGLIALGIDSAVNSSRTSTMMQLVDPIRKEMRDYNFRARFNDSFQNTLPGIQTIDLARFDRGVYPITDKERDTLRLQTSENGLLTVSTRYELGSDFQSLYIVSAVALWLRGEEKAAYLSNYHYYTPPIAPDKGREDAARAWAANHAAALRAALDEGIAETMKMFLADLRSSPPALPVESETKFSKGSILARASADSITFLVKDKTRYIVRYKDILFSASTDQQFVSPAPMQ